MCQGLTLGSAAMAAPQRASITGAPRLHGTFFWIQMIEAARLRFMMIQRDFRRPEDL
jgi:hypothetical protein